MFCPKWMIPCTSLAIVLSSCPQGRIYYFDFLVFFVFLSNQLNKSTSFVETLNLTFRCSNKERF